MLVNTALFHELCIDILYGCLALVTFVLIERLVFFGLLSMQVQKIASCVELWRHSAQERLPAFQGRDLMTGAMVEYVDFQKKHLNDRSRIEDFSSELFIRVNQRVGARLWILDTVVTAAPLLGLLGTILGIMDTFNALSSGGISDPAAVSKGIAAALLATAIGILTALYGLLAHNIIHRNSDVLSDRFKQFLLSATHSASAQTAAE